MPTVTPNWLTVPKPPRKFNGAISEMYMGTNDVFNPEKSRSIHLAFNASYRLDYEMVPQLKPMIILPIMSISYDWAALEKAIRIAPRIPVALFSSRPRFL